MSRSLVSPMHRAILLIGITVCLGGCEFDPEGPLDPATAEARLRARIETMTAEGFLADPERSAHPEATTELFDRLAKVDFWLDEISGWDDSDGVPNWWDDEVVPSLPVRLRPLDAFYTEITLLLQEEKISLAIESGESLAYRTSILWNEAEIDAFATPPLPRAERWIDLLCAKTVETGKSSLDADTAMRCLTEAFDLLHLLDDGSMAGRRTCVALESRLLLALRTVAPGSAIDPVRMQSELEPRLAVVGDRLRPWETLRSEISRRVQTTLELLDNPGRPDEELWLTSLGTTRAGLAERALDAIHVQDELRAASTLCVRIGQFNRDHPFQELIDTIDGLHQLGSACYVARVGLAANEFRFIEGDWPRYLSDLSPEYIDGRTPPLACRTKRPTYKRGFRDVRLSVSGRMALAGNPDRDPLFEWSWSSEVISQFPRRLH